MGFDIYSHYFSSPLSIPSEYIVAGYCHIRVTNTFLQPWPGGGTGVLGVDRKAE